MSAIAVLIYISPKIESSYLTWVLEPLEGKPLLEHLFSGLAQVLEGENAEFFVVCHDDAFVPRAKAALSFLGYELFASKGFNKVEVLGDFAKAHKELKNLLVFEEGTVFPDAEGTQELLSLHQKQNADASQAPELPMGLVPTIFFNGALRRLANLGLPSDVGSDPWTVMSKANQLFAGDASMTFRLTTATQSMLGNTRPPLSTLPSAVLVSDELSYRAAEKALHASMPEPCSGWGRATVMKSEGLAISLGEPDIRFPEFSKRPQARPVLYSTVYNAFSGAEESFSQLISHVDREQVAPLVLLHKPGRLSERLLAAGVPVLLTRFDFAKDSPYTRRYFDRVFAAHGTALLHVNGSAGLPLVTQASARGIPVIHHVRGFLGKNALPEQAFARKVIVVSDAVAEDLKRSDLAPEKIVRIYNGMDFSAFRVERYDRKAVRARLGISEDTWTLTMIARLCEQKRQEFLIKALPAALKAIPKLQVLLVGEAYAADIPYRKRLMDFIQGNRLSGVVRLLGFQKEIAEVHAASDALVLCTENEPFGRSMLEAMAMGVPVVLPKTGGHLELIRDHENGLLYDPQDPAALSAAITELASNLELAQTLASNARRNVEAFSIQSHVDQVLKIYAL